MSPTPEQIVIIGFVASLFVQAVKMVATALNKPINRKAITWVMVVISVILALVFSIPVFPALPVLPAAPPVTGEPFDVTLAILAWLPIVIEIGFKFVCSILALITAYAGFAAVIYNLVFEKVYQGLELKITKAISKK